MEGGSKNDFGGKKSGFGRYRQRRASSPPPEAVLTRDKILQRPPQAPKRPRSPSESMFYSTDTAAVRSGSGCSLPAMVDPRSPQTSPRGAGQVSASNRFQRDDCSDSFEDELLQQRPLDEGDVDDDNPLASAGSHKKKRYRLMPRRKLDFDSFAGEESENQQNGSPNQTLTSCRDAEKSQETRAKHKSENEKEEITKAKLAPGERPPNPAHHFRPLSVENDDSCNVDDEDGEEA